MNVLMDTRPFPITRLLLFLLLIVILSSPVIGAPLGTRVLDDQFNAATNWTTYVMHAYTQSAIGSGYLQINQPTSWETYAGGAYNATSAQTWVKGYNYSFGVNISTDFNFSVGFCSSHDCGASVYLVEYSNIVNRSPLNTSGWLPQAGKPEHSACILGSPYGSTSGSLNPGPTWTYYQVDIDRDGLYRVNGGSWAVLGGWNNISSRFNIDLFGHGYGDTFGGQDYIRFDNVSLWEYNQATVAPVWPPWWPSGPDWFTNTSGEKGFYDTGGYGLWHYINGSVDDVYNYPVEYIVFNTSPTYSYADGNTIYINGTFYPDFGDLRFVNESGVVLPYWINKTFSDHIDMWVNFPYIKGGSTNNFIIYWNNATLMNAENGYDTFSFFDDFEGATINATQYSAVPSSYTVSNSVLNITPTFSIEALKISQTFPVNTSLVVNLGLGYGIHVNPWTELIYENSPSISDRSQFYFGFWTAQESICGGPPDYCYGGYFDASNIYNKSNIYELSSLSRGGFLGVNDPSTWTATVPMSLDKYGQIRTYARQVSLDSWFVRKRVEPEPGYGPLPHTPISVSFTSNKVIDYGRGSVRFTDTSTNIGYFATYYWDFGDGYTSTDQNPDHVYYNLGSYNVNHSVTNYIGTYWDNKTNYIQILFKQPSSPSVDISVYYPTSPEPVGEIWHRAGSMPERLSVPSVASFDGKLWIVGGFDTDLGDNVANVWSSPDGSIWTLVTGSPGFSNRSSPAVAAFNNKLWVIGGDVSPQDVWSSPDGLTWTHEADIPATTYPFNAFLTHPVILDDMYIIGGAWEDDVWASHDGIDWFLLNLTSSNTYYGDTSVFDSKLWSIGGLNMSDSQFTNSTYYSTDGNLWYVAIDKANWDERQYLVANTFDGKLWVIGGQVPELPESNETWYSEDGISWTLANASAEFGARFWDMPNSAVLGDKLFIFGGYDQYGNLMNDIWYTRRNTTHYVDSSTPVNFNDASNGVNITSWYWDFGDCTESFAQDAVHIYSYGGTYTVNHSATVWAGTPYSRTSWYNGTTVVVYGPSPPDANFVSNLTIINNGNCVQFTDASTGLGILGRLWDFGDGTITSGGTPISHCYYESDLTIPHHYTVSLTVTTGSCGDTETKVNYLYMPSSFEVLPPTYAPTTPPPTGTPEPPVALQHPISFDFANGTYLSYWINGSVSELPVNGFIWSLILPLWTFFGWWLFAIIWFVFIMGIYLNTQDIGMPLIIGAIAATVMAAFFPWEAKIVAVTVLALCLTGILMKIYYEAG